MISGRQVLTSIDQSINEAHDKISDIEGRIQSITQELAAQQQASGQDYRALAKVRLDQLVDDEITRHLDQAERQVVALFAQREEALAALQAEILNASEDLKSLAADRLVQAERVDEAATVVDSAEAKTQARLDQDAGYCQQRDAAEALARKVLHAAEKASRSEAEMEHKGASYRNDPLFMYLWTRNYGLPAYEASGLVRWLDAKVARLIGYSDARANFTRLNEIPVHLRQHADGISALAEIEFANLKHLDEAAREADGMLPLVGALDDAQIRLDDIDATIEQREINHKVLLNKRSTFATGDDKHTQQAIAFLAAESKRDDLTELRHDALNTPFPDDDLIVSRMLEREHQRVDLEATVDGFKRAIQQQQQRLSEFESLRVDFKRQRYDRAGSMFKDNSIIGMMIGQFLSGMLDKGMLWKVLQEQQRYQPRRSNPDFGSGGFGRGSVWNGGIGDVLDGMVRGGFPRGGGGGGRGGGFRTGGGF